MSSSPPALPCASAERKAGVPPALTAFRAQEGRQAREAKLRELWERVPFKDPNSPPLFDAVPTSPSSSTQPSSTSTEPSSSSLPPSSSKIFSAISIPPSSSSSPSAAGASSSSANTPGLSTTLSPERADALRKLYEDELIRRCMAEPMNPDSREFAGEGLQPWDQLKGTAPRREKVVDWKGFRTYLWEKESELWQAFHDLDRNQDGMLDVEDMRTALRRADITLTPATLSEFVNFLSTGKEGLSSDHVHSKQISWLEFRDMLLMLPRSASAPEIYKFYQVRKRYPDGRGAARVNSEGDLSASFPNPPPSPTKSKPPPTSEPKTEPSTFTGSGLGSTSLSSSSGSTSLEQMPALDGKVGVDGCGATMGGVAGIGEGDEELEEEEEDEEDHNGISGLVALKFLAAGGIAGAVSRTATAPFDRLKVFLITDSTPSTTSDVKPVVDKAFSGFNNLKRAVMRLYLNGGGLRAFWVGNGLNVIKIMPESAIKFFSYESSKRFLARYWDKVDDQSQISGSSRFLSGGLGGISSQFAIYPLETLKTQHMTTAGSDHSSKVLLRTAANMWANGGVQRYYRGLTLSLVGVFPYAAIDMSTFETLKIAYCRHFGIEEPETYATLAFGAVSGGVGATSVYPINLLRTKLQASGSTGHPQTYDGFYDVLQKTMAKEGWRGMYRGLTVTLAKVVPAVSISYVVYEESKRKLGL